MTTIGIDLTNALARFSGQPSPVWLPSVVLPMTDNEPIITGESVKRHRRGSGLKWPPECQIPYGSSATLGKGRIALADVWRYLSPFEVQDEAWDNYQPFQQKISWQPDPVNLRSIISFSAEELVAQVVCSVYPGIHAAEQVSLIVPDDLGEGAQQALLDAFGGVPGLHLLPRPIAIACHWCAEQDASQFPSKMRRCGFIWVLSMGIDRWELCQVEIRKENNRLIPVRDHTVFSSGVAVDGLSMLAAYAIAAGKSKLDSVWYDLMIGDLAEELNQSPMVSCSSNFYNQACNGIRNWQGRLSGESLGQLFAPEEIEKVLIRRWKEQRPQDFRGLFGRQRNSCLAAIADGSLAMLAIDDVPLGQFLLKEFSEQVIVSDGVATFRGAEQVARQMAQDEVPYYDQIAPVLIYYQGRDEFNDPIIDTKPLIEARTVAAGEIARTARPISEFSILGGKDSLSLVLKRDFGKKSEIRQVSAELKEQTKNDEPVVITAEIKAGQGFAKAQVVSVKTGLFESMLNWRKMELCAEPEQPKYAWPPGVADVRSNLSERDLAPFREMSKLLGDYNPRRSISADVRSFRQSINLWVRTGVPYRYEGSIPSTDSIRSFPCPEVLQELSDNLGDAISISPEDRDLVRLAGWLYEACPKEALTAVKQRLRACEPFPCDLEVAGKAFVQRKDVHLFVGHFNKIIHVVNGLYQGDTYNNWVRAFRDMIRFRIDTLRPEFISNAQINCIEKYIIELMWYESDVRRTKYNNCLYIAPHLLKRRRFDDGFLAVGGERWKVWVERFEFASEHGLNWQKKVASAMINLLNKKGSLGDVTILARNEGK